MKLKSSPAKLLAGTIKVPGDKSISHRSIMLGSLAEGTSSISNFLEGEDSIATLKAFESMGIKINRPFAGEVEIEGVGLHGLKPPAKAIYLGNSGTAMRLLSGIMAGQKFTGTLTGDSSLSSRPMRRITEPLSLMGAKIKTENDGTAPLIISKGNLTAIEYQMPVASAQVKSAILLAGLYAAGKTCVIEPAPSRDHTERMLQGFGWNVEKKESKVCIAGGGRLKACNIEVPNDISSAAFFMVAASIAANADVTMTKVGINQTRTGVIEILKMMGADIKIINKSTSGGEPVADIRVKSSRLHGIAIPENLVPLAIDEFPALFIAAACAEGTTILSGAEELRVKESDRIAAMEQGLLTLGVKAKATMDGMIIDGPGKFQGGTVDSFDDHRIAMAFAIAACHAQSDILIKNCENINTSFPGFIETANAAGMKINQA